MTTAPAPSVHLPSQLTALRSALRTAGEVAGGIAEGVRHPRSVADRARRLPTALPLLRQAVEPILTGHLGSWDGEYAYTAGVQAFVYGFPYVYNAQIRHDWVTRPRDPDVVPYAPVNSFWHATRLLDETYRDGGCPNNDTLYSIAWLDLSDGPVVLSHPDMGERYFAFQVAAFTSDNVDVVGQRTTGSAAGDFAIVGPGWTGDLPHGVRMTTPSPTPWVLLLGRTLVDGTADLMAARSAQGQYLLTPLSLWEKPRPATPTVRRDVYAPTPAEVDPLGPWRTLNAMLAENPPPEHHRLLLDQWRRVGIGAGLEVDEQPATVQQGLARAAMTGLELLQGQFLSGDWATDVNGWRYPPPEEGRFGDDFLLRAADQSLAGIVANDPAEAVYLVNFSDAEGAPLLPGSAYELSFTADELPPVDAFWSLTAYTAGDLNLVPNPAHRYSIGDRTPGLVHDPDGGLTLRLRPTPPEQVPANWLPTSADRPWFVILRLYRPHPEVVAATWRCPGIRRVS